MKPQEALYNRELQKVSKDTAVAAAATVFGIGFTYLITFISTRALGAEDYGVFVLAQTILLTSAMVATLGLSHGVVRFVSLFQGQKDNERMKGTLVFALTRVPVAAILLGTAVYFFAPFAESNIFKTPNLSFAVRVLLIVLPFVATGEILLAGLQGLRLVSQQTIIKNVVQSTIRLVLLVVFFYLGMGLTGLLLATAFSLVASCCVAFYTLKKRFLQANQKTNSILEKSRITRFSIPLFLDIIFTRITGDLPILMLAYYLSASDVGVLGLSIRVALFVSLPLASLNLIFAPTISNLYGQGAKGDLTRLFKTLTRWIFTLSLAFGSLLLLFARQVMALFGEQFVTGASALAFLVAGELVNASVGSVGYLLMMTGRTKISLANSVLQVVITLIVGWLLIPHYGLVGAGMTMGIAITIVNIVRLTEVYYYERIHPYDMNFLKPIAAGSGAVLSVLLVRFLFPSENMVNISVSLLLYGMTFIMGLSFLRLCKEDIMILNSVRRRLALSWPGH